jgi:hypothetical protein
VKLGNLTSIVLVEIEVDLCIIYYKTTFVLFFLSKPITSFESSNHDKDAEKSVAVITAKWQQPMP